MAYAASAYNLDRPDESGTTVRAALTRVHQQTGELPDELRDEPRLPRAVQHVYLWFVELAAARRSGFGPDPIAFAEIQAWATLTLRQPRPWEVRAIRAMDDKILRLVAEEQKRKAKKG